VLGNKDMKTLTALTGALFILGASPAAAASYSESFGSSFAGFNSSLGTLTRVKFDLSGTTTFAVTLGADSSGDPPSGPVTYMVQNGAFLYAYLDGGGLFDVQPYLRQTGSGTADAVFGEFEITTSGLHGITQITDPALLAAFLDSHFTAHFFADPPFDGFLTVNGLPYGLDADFVDTDVNIGGTVTYYYRALGGVPEPASWVMMVTGFGAAGAMVRRTRRRTIAFG